jgi:glycosyltransferase involved in cell wall biosynthesis
LPSLPKISIITPTYNQGAFIEQTILSVIGQNYPNLEYMIFDAGSIDNTVDIIKKYEKSLAYWTSEKDKGQSDAINKGFAKATGDILMWLNSDDLLMPNALSVITGKVDINLCAIYFGNCIHFKNDNGLTSWGSDVERQHRELLLENIDYIIQPSSFWTRKTWNEVGELKEDLHYVFDWEWFLRAKNKKIQFVPLSECLSLYRIHSSHKSGSGGTVRDKEICEIYEAYMPGNETLFRFLVEDKDLLMKKYFFFLKNIANLFSLRIHDVRLLKMLKPSRYKPYADGTINQVRLAVTNYN